jgi:hypothetical protein
MCLGVSLTLVTGCKSTSKQPSTAAAPAQPKPAAAPSSGYGPSYTTYEEGGLKYTKGSMAFPTGQKASSTLLLEKVVPAEVMAGKSFQYVYRVGNLTDHDLQMVTVTDRVTPNFSAADATPKPDKVDGGVATWNLGDLGPKQVKEIKVTGTAKEEGTVVTCGWASCSPILCEPIKIVKANINLVKTLPAEVVICDPIPAKIVVQNTGSSVLTGVKVTDPLPAGLSADGKTALSFEVGTLNPGQSKEITFAATASKTGRFVNTAKVTSAQGVEGEASAETVVRQPVLQLSCQAPDERFAGRGVTVCLTVANKGDTAAAGTVVTMPVPASATFTSATAGGQLSGNNVVWNVGALAAGASKELCVTLTAATPTTLNFAASAKGTCATQVSTTCSTKVSGIPAILLEVVDLEDPIEVGSTVNYRIDVTNQGSAPGTGIKIVCELEDEQQFTSGSGSTAVTGSGQKITMAPVASLAPKAKASWQVSVKALKAKNIRFKVSMTSDQMPRPVEETESTNQY